MPVELFIKKQPINHKPVKLSKRQNINLEKFPFTSQQIGPFISGPMSSEIPQVGGQQPLGHDLATFNTVSLS